MKDTDKLELTDHAEGTALPVKATAGSSRSRIVGVLGGRLKVAVAAAPEKGKANRAIAGLLADALGVAKRDVVLAAGPANPKKTFIVRGMIVQQIRSRLERL